ncbi:MAG: 16S rRNA (guanine(966)-N(2))-methyltransferase RsmD [Acidobacteria bacterium]|nr:16S rRNA (guanine(966)-N(2))-methyltransferase RsmD [Acidobacteriota bacterium]
MRVIAGLYKGHSLKTLAGLDVRPTSDRLRETLFNILAPKIANTRFLDICAGSGAVAIEALSRGASFALLIEVSKQATKVIQDNITHCKIPSNYIQITTSDALSSLKKLEKNNALFDIVYFDPPYKSSIYLPVLQYLGEVTFLSDTSIVIVEHHSKFILPEIIGQLNCYRRLKQGETELSFYEVTKYNVN